MPFALLTWLAACAYNKSSDNSAASLAARRAQACSTVYRDAFMYDQENILGTQMKFPSLSGRNNGSMLFVHVGKTCGTTVASRLSSAKIHFSQVHAVPVKLDALQRHTLVLIAIREPVDRLISAYWDIHPSEGKEGKHPESKKEFYRCFPTAEDFATGLSQRHSSCGQIAHGMLHPATSNGSHMLKGLCYYLGGVREHLFTKQILVTETATCTDDTSRVIEWMRPGSISSDGGDTCIHCDRAFSQFSGNRLNASGELVQSVPAAASAVNTGVSAAGRALMKAVLVELGEYDLYEDLKQAAHQTTGVRSRLEREEAAYSRLQRQIEPMRKEAQGHLDAHIGKLLMSGAPLPKHG